MKREREPTLSPLDELASTPRDPASPPSTEPIDPEPPSDPEPSDPDAAMYAAIRARPNWLEKPKVKQLIQELSEGLGPGEDLFYWDMRRRHRPRPVQPSNAEEHRILTVPPQASPLTETLRSARVIVQEPPHAARPRPGRNGPRPRDTESKNSGSDWPPRPPSHRPPREPSSRRWFAAVLVGLALLFAGVALGLLHGWGTRPARGPVPAAPPSCGVTGR